MIRNQSKFLRILPAGFDGVFDWDFLLPAFEGTRIQPTDIDCIVERCGQFIVFETKTGDAPVPRGQEILLEKLVKTGFFTVVILWCKQPLGIDRYEAWILTKDRRVKRCPVRGDADGLVQYLQTWRGYAESNQTV